MLFNSVPFLAFFVLIASLFFILPPKYRWILLIGASYYFYMYWDVSFLFLLFFCTLFDFLLGLAIARTTGVRRRKAILAAGIGLNLSLLFFFKYYNFAVDSVRPVLETLGWDGGLPALRILLPIGISFYTFHSLSYIVDVYRGEIPAERHFGKYAIYVCFFPLLVAGPIMRASRLLPQLQDNAQKPNSRDLVAGFSQAMFGFFKKVVVADTLAAYVDSIYGHWQINTGATFVLATWLFAFQIYCDFSGYSDIATGIARIMGYDLIVNFRQPYFSKTVTEFWRRWHISLSSWLKDYLYIPLGGNRKGTWKTYRNLILTMLLGGLWHGASWNFMVWGLLNGVYLSAEKFLGLDKLRLTGSLWARVAATFVTFNLICLTWIFFKSGTWAQAWHILGQIAFHPDFAGLNLNNKSLLVISGLLLASAMAFEYLFLRKRTFIELTERAGYPALLSFNLSLFILILLFGVDQGSQFIYFQF